MIGITEILILFTTIFGIFYLWMKYHYSYWKRHNVPYIPPKLFFGNMKDIVLVRNGAAEGLQELYNHENAKNEPFVGIHIFHQPALLIREPELIKRILISDFSKFSNRFATSDPHSDTLGGYILLFLKNPLWRQIRTKLSPFFSSGKMKQMFTLMTKTGKDLDTYLSSLSKKSSKEPIRIDVKDTAALYTTDVIVSTVYGIEANCFNNPKGEFRKYGNSIFNFTFYRAIEFVSFFFLPKLASFCKFKFFANDTANFLRSTVKYVINEREKSGIFRNDLIDSLIALKNAPRDDKNDIKFEDDILYAQPATFFTAGFETSSSAMSFAVYELAKNLECQERLRNEIKEMLQNNNGELVYDIVMNMPYLHMVLEEVLRLYPSLPFVDRECTLPKGQDGYSLEPYSDFLVPNGMPIYIPIYAIQRDPKYYPDPNTFNPDRFSPENKRNQDQITNIPFGTGPRNCIGERFGYMSAKIGLVSFLRNHRIKPAKDSPKIIKLKKEALVTQSEGGISCDIIWDPLI